MLPRDTLLDDRYRIIELLGTGAMGSVYLALDERLSSNVAVKGTIFKRFNLAPEAENELRRAFEREAKLLANLQHEAVPRVGDYFFHDDEQYLVMEYIAGGDLYDQAEKQRRKGKSFDVVTVSDWALQLLDALHYLHTQSEPVIHKDIKLSNLKVTGRNRIKLLDFGISKGFAGEMTRVEAGSLQMGTEEYAPIEQYLKFPSKAAETLRQALSIKHADKVQNILNQSTDARSDLYSLAVTLYRLLTNRPPADYLPRALAVWEGGADPIIPIHELNREVPVSVSNVIMHALALEKDERPFSAAAMRDEFQLAWSEYLRSTQQHQTAPPEETIIEQEKQELQLEIASDYERQLTEERDRRQLLESELAERERELAAISSRLQEITSALNNREPSANLKGRKTAPGGNAADGDSILSRLLGRKHFLTLLLGLVLLSGAAFTWRATQSSANAQEIAQHVERGSVHLRNKAFEAALKEFDAALKLDPKNLYALSNQADAFCQQGDAERAFAQFNKVFQIDPDYNYLYDKRGFCYEKRGMTDEAIADYTKAIELDNDDTWTYARRAELYLQKKEYEKALADYTALIQLKPDDSGAYHNRALIYQILGKQTLAAADSAKADQLKEKTINN